MTQRSMQAGAAPRLIVRTNGDITIKGWEGERVMAETSPDQVAQIKRRAGGIEVQLSGNGHVLVPFNSQVELYCGGSAAIEQIAGPVSAVASHDLRLHRIRVLAQASAGWSVEIDCQGVASDKMRFTAGRDLRCRITGMSGVHFIVDDLSGRWDQTLGNGQVQIRLTAGGEVTLLAPENR